MSELLRATAIGTDLTRVEGPAKVRGRVPYAYEHPLEEPLHLHPLCATIARGRVSSIDASAASALDGVVRVITHHDRSEEHTSELQSRGHLVCRLLLEKKKTNEKCIKSK